MDDPSCIFSSQPDPPLLYYDKGVGECAGTLSRLGDVRLLKYPLYGAVDSLDLLLLRGGRVICWENQDVNSEIDSSLVCQHHLSSLLLNWEKNTFSFIFGKKHRKKSLVCSLPEVKHAKNRPISSNRMLKKDAIQYMAKLGILCHVGTPVCTSHFNAIRLSQFEMFKVSDEQLQPEIDVQSHQPIDETFDDYDDPLYVQQLSSREVTPEPENNTETDRIEALRCVLAQFGIKRLLSENPWHELTDETKMRKVLLVIKFLDEIFKISAGEKWKLMKDIFKQQMAVVQPDPRVDTIMHTIGQCLEDTSDKSVRISVLKMVTGVFSEKEISEGTGASRYLIRQAKLSSFNEIRAIKAFQRERYNRQKVLMFLRFLSKPEILNYLPNACKSFTLGNGCDVSIASMARLYSYREIFDLFSRYCEDLGRSQGLLSQSDLKEFVRVTALGYSTAYKLMEVIAPNRTIRMSCVDSFQVSAFDAYDELSFIIDELSVSKVITTEKAVELRRRIRVSRNFMFGELRLHVTEESNVQSHCWKYALSDPKDARFSSTCNHIHDSSCTECDDAINVSNIVRGIVEDPHKEATRNNNPIRFRLGRMLELCQESDSLLRHYRQHVIRCVASEHDRRQIIDNLVDGEALITADYSMKILPTDAIERQSQWYAKAGISFHMCAIVGRINGELVTHSFGHVSSISKQDSMAVSGILDHALGILQCNGIDRVHIRTDNAGTYHSVSLIATLLHYAGNANISILSHIFSEPQYGKGFADREISLAKGKLNSFIDSGNSASTPSQILQGFTHNILMKGCSFHLIEVDLITASNATLNGIKQYSSFRFEPNVGVRVKKHDSIGEGMMVKIQKLPPMKFKWKIHKEGGYLSQSENFWKKMKSTSAITEDDELEIFQSEEQDSTEEIRRCPDMLCISRFKTERGLLAHVTKGVHKYYKATETVTDFALQSFSNMVETTVAAQIAVKEDSIVSLNLNANCEEQKIGWALRKNDRVGPLDPEVKKEVEKLIIEQLDNGKRAEAREIRDQLRAMVLNDGSYRFSIKKCLSESQIKSQITRILNLRKKDKGEVNNNGGIETEQNSLESPKKCGRKRTEHKLQKPDQKRKKRGRPSKNSLEEMDKESEEEIIDIEDDSNDEDDINCLELMESEIERMIDDIFDTN